MLVLQISAERNLGLVSVRDETGAPVQKLSCPLLRDNTAASPDELAAVREQFLRQFVVRDLDSDGHPDLAGIREFGAKWARYCVWLYDPMQHFFAKDFLAEQMELMTNLEPLAGRQISASHIGSENMWRAVYRITDVEGSRPERQLVPVYSCLVETKPGGEKLTAVVQGKTQVASRARESAHFPIHSQSARKFASRKRFPTSQNQTSIPCLKPKNAVTED